MSECEPDVVLRVDGARGVRTWNGQCILTATYASNSHVGVGHPSPERSVNEDVDAGQRGHSQTVLCCGRLELKNRRRSPQEWSRRQGHCAPWVPPSNWCGGARPGSTTRTEFWMKGRCKRKPQVRQACRTAHVGAGDCLDVRYSEWKCEIKKIKKGTATTRSCQGRGSRGRGNRSYASRGSVRETSSSGCGTAPKAKPVGISVVVSFSRCSRQGSRSSGLEACDLGRIEPRHSRGTHHSAGGRPTQPRRSSAGLEAGGPPFGATSHLHQILQPMYSGLGARKLRELETLSEIMDQLAAGQFGRAADVATQRYKAIEMAMQDGVWKRTSHLELLPDAQRLLTGRDEQELITRAERISGRRPCSLAEGLGRQGQGPRIGQTLGQGERTPASHRKESSATRAKLSRRKPLQRGRGPLRRSRISTRRWRPWRVLICWRARLPLMLTFIPSGEGT